MESPNSLNCSQVEALVHEYVNQVRTTRGLSTLALDTGLCEIARNHNQDMATRKYFSHFSPEGDGPKDRYEQFGYECQLLVEDYVYNQPRGGG